MMWRVISRIERYFEPSLIVVLISSMTVIIVAQIISRLFGFSFSQAEEISRFLFVWAMYLAISYAIRDDRHIRVSVLVDALPSIPRNIALNCADLVFLFYSVLIVFVGYGVIEQSLALGQIAPATELPIAAVYGSVFVGSVLNVVRLVLRLHERVIEIDRSRSGA